MSVFEATGVATQLQPYRQRGEEKGKDDALFSHVRGQEDNYL